MGIREERLRSQGGPVEAGAGSPRGFLAHDEKGGVQALRQAVEELDVLVGVQADAGDYVPEAAREWGAEARQKKKWSEEAVSWLDRI